MRKLHLLLLFALPFVLAACGSAETLIYTEVPADLLAQEEEAVRQPVDATLTAQGPLPVSPTAPPTASPTPQPEEETQPEQAEAGEVTEAPTTEPVVEESSPRPALGFEAGDPNLKASDPSTVALASGRWQLIEFFAFW